MKTYLLLLTLLLTLALVPTVTSKKTKIDTSIYANICGKSFPALPPRGHKILEILLPLVGRTSLKANTTPQHAAMCWIVHTDTQKPSAKSPKMLQRYALAVLYAATKGEGWLQKTDWLTGKNECRWYGVVCDYRSRVVTISMPFNNLVGLLPRDVAMLKYLVELDFKANELQGVIPVGIGELTSLRVLRLNMNGFFGNIPKEIGNLKKLRELNLYGNYLMGTLPTTIGNLVKLETLDLYANTVGGAIPTQLGKMKSLKEVYLNDNNFNGKITTETGKRLKNLTELWTDCRGTKPEVTCDFCTVCCKDDANPKCERKATAVKVKK